MKQQKNQDLKITTIELKPKSADLTSCSNMYNKYMYICSNICLLLQCSHSHCIHFFYFNGRRTFHDGGNDDDYDIDNDYSGPA